MGVILPIVSEFDAKGTQRAVKEFQKLEGASAKAQFAIKKAAVPAAAALAGLGVALVGATKAAMEDQAEQVQLALALTNVTGASEAQIKAEEDMITKMSLASGVADSELRPALAALTRGTHDIAEANKALALAQDISAGSGKDLATVSDALAKAYGGNMKALGTLSPEIKAMVKDGASLDEIMNVLGGSFGGASAAAAATAEGGMKRLGIALAETKESIGAALIPVVEALLPHLIAFGAWAQEHTKTFLIVAGAIGGIALTILALNAAMKVYAAAQMIVNGVVAIFNALLLANPVTLVILAIVAFIAILAALYFKFETVRKIVDTVFDAMLAGGRAVFDGLTTYFTGVYNIFKMLFNGIAKMWNNTVGKLSFEFPSWVIGLGGKGFSVPNIPYLADGGIVTGPTLAMIGERGPEAVIPLSGRGGGMGNYTINITGGLGSSAEIGTAVVNAIRAFNRQNGPANIAVA
ncbi:hypothetical protein UFOVP1060_17 [uncultured Caudovirales phage]|uniref:Phage tail tape measure protein n=4 Tax=uncultured Caudovirales phage TaxID=2100421 RepID=A0A6J7XCG0_9CAUD|nr:hypothetical protein UFOVP1060_17 [uncultured Caudovirales phage]CAB5226643.1 hypothetical protein UFOVP1510_21 [uncultured Caudovirales phage]